jgi:uncharacterized protein YuzE
MQLTYDAEADILYFRFRDGVVEESEEVAPNVVVDLDPAGRAIGIEIGAASRQLDGEPQQLALRLPSRRPRDPVEAAP